MATSEVIIETCSNKIGLYMIYFFLNYKVFYGDCLFQSNKAVNEARCLLQVRKIINKAFTVPNHFAGKDV